MSTQNRGRSTCINTQGGGKKKATHAREKSVCAACDTATKSRAHLLISQVAVAATTESARGRERKRLRGRRSAAKHNATAKKKKKDHCLTCSVADHQRPADETCSQPNSADTFATCTPRQWTRRGSGEPPRRAQQRTAKHAGHRQHHVHAARTDPTNQHRRI